MTPIPTAHMSDHHPSGGSDMGAAFVGLIGGAAFIGAILWGIVIVTNRHFEAEKAAHGADGAKKTSAVMTTPVQVA